MKKLSVCVYCGSRAGNLPAYVDHKQRRWVWQLPEQDGALSMAQVILV